MGYQSIKAIPLAWREAGNWGGSGGGRFLLELVFVKNSILQYTLSFSYSLQISQNMIQDELIPTSSLMSNERGVVSLPGKRNNLWRRRISHCTECMSEVVASLAYSTHGIGHSHGWSWPLPFIHAWVGQEVKEGINLNPIKLFLLCPRESTCGEEWFPYSAIYHLFSCFTLSYVRNEIFQKL